MPATRRHRGARRTIGGARGCSRCHGSGAQKGIGYTVDVPDSLEVKVELEIDDDESSLEIELTW